MTLTPMSKEELIYTRISSALKDRLAIEAHNRGEAEAVIVREALNQYFVRVNANQPLELGESHVKYRLKRKRKP